MKLPRSTVEISFYKVFYVFYPKVLGVWGQSLPCKKAAAADSTRISPAICHGPALSWEVMQVDSFVWLTIGCTREPKKRLSLGNPKGQTSQDFKAPTNTILPTAVCCQLLPFFHMPFCKNLHSMALLLFLFPCSVADFQPPFSLGQGGGAQHGLAAERWRFHLFGLSP